MTVGEKFTYFFGFFTNYYQSTVFTGKSRCCNVTGAAFTVRPIPKHLSQVSGPVSYPDV
jgi:hypothetical protein